MDHFFIILSIVWLAVISPGADFAMVSRLSVMHGYRVGYYAALGIAAACWFHIFYAIFGLAVVERWFPNLLVIIKFVGAAYLIYLGLAMALSRPVRNDGGGTASTVSPARTLLTGILTNGLNPKTSIFVVSLYAQIIGPTATIGRQLGYGLLISVSHLLWFGLVATCLSRPAIRASVLARQHVANGVIGSILVLLGLALGFADLGQGISTVSLRT